MKIRPFAVLFSALVMLTAPASAGAALIINSSVSSPAGASVFATWTSPDAASVISDIGGPFWDIDLISSSFGEFEVTVAQHRVALHAGEAPLGPALVLSFFDLLPGSGSAARSVSRIHPPGPHADALMVRITPVAAGVSTVSIQATHVPEPGALGLALAGFGLLLLARRRTTLQ
jgi:MYXO-CTERM domain-containing protein